MDSEITKINSRSIELRLEWCVDTKPTGAKGDFAIAKISTGDKLNLRLCYRLKSTWFLYPSDAFVTYHRCHGPVRELPYESIWRYSPDSSQFS